MLYDYISFLSRKYWAAGWMHDIEYDLWDNLMSENVGKYKRAELTTLRSLSMISGGWMTFDDGFILRDEWENIFEKWKTSKERNQNAD